jgi:hypothetical protein
MISVGEYAEEYIGEYKAADPASRNRKREIALFEFYKWELIKGRIEEIEADEGEG